MMPEIRDDMEKQKVKERELLLKKALLYSDCLPKFGREVGEAYSLQFNEHGYDSSYNRFDPQKAVPLIAARVDEEKLLRFFEANRDSVSEYVDFRGRFYTLRGARLTAVSEWSGIEHSFWELCERRGESLPLMLQACYRVSIEMDRRRDNYFMIRNVASDTGVGAWQQVLADLEMIGLVQRDKGDIWIPEELVPLVERLLGDLASLKERAEPDLPQNKEIQAPKDLFSTIASYDDIKAHFSKVLGAERYHILLVGPPASAKTVFLLELARLPGSFYCLGSATTKAGLAEILYEQRPRILLADEIDKFANKDIAILLSLAETGIIRETKVSKQREVRLNTNIFAAANSTRGMPKELLSRFRVLYLPEYTREEFIEAAKRVLLEREKVEPELASYIAERTWGISRDVREAVRVGKTCRTQEEVDKDIRLMRKYGRAIAHMVGQSPSA